MGLYTRVVEASGRVIQIKTNNDALETYRLGDKLQEYSQIKDGVYVGLYENWSPFEGALVAIHNRHIIGVIPYNKQEAELAYAIAWAYRDSMETDWE